jgi:transposase-like protein
MCSRSASLRVTGWCAERAPADADFLLTAHRDRAAALRFLTKATRRHGVPEAITIDGSEANAAAIRSYNKEYRTAIGVRQVRYLNNIVEQDHRSVKRVARPM